MAGILKWIVPKDDLFFDLLNKQSENALDGAKELRNFVKNYHELGMLDKKQNAKRLKNYETMGDEITHRIMESLDKTFITPIDKEDIHRVAVLLDDVVDLLNIVGQRFIILGIKKIDEYIIKLVDIINSSITELNECIHDLKAQSNLKHYYIKIHTLENDADDVLHEAISELFHDHNDPIDIIKYKEIYELLEKITDKCEDITHVTESVVVKHA